MGQYYAPVVLKENWRFDKKPVVASLKCYDFDNGAKLMEHSYVHNNFVGAAMKMIDLFDPDKKGVIFAWVGDYADLKDTSVYPIVKVEKTREDGSIYEDEEGGVDIHGMAWQFIDHGDYNNNTPEYIELEKTIGKKLYQYRYIINHDKKQYVVVPTFKPQSWIIHPLPILTADGVGRGSGDYHEKYPDGTEKENAKFVGAWAYDHISVSNRKSDCNGMTRIDWFTECED